MFSVTLPRSRHGVRFTLAMALTSLVLAACGGGGGGNAVPTYSVGGTVTGLAGGALVLQNAGLNNLTVSANGAFTFSNLLASGTNYSVTVATQPTNPAQTCTVSNGSGTISGNVTNVVISCTTSAFTVGGTVSGLVGTGLVLQQGGANSLAVNASGSFEFVAAVPSGTAYAVTVLTQPSNPTQTCSVASGTGTVGAGNITNVAITCSVTTYTVGGTVSGLVGTGLVLQNNAGNNLAVTENGAFTFTTPVASGGAYTVTVLAQPAGPAQTCFVVNGTGTIGANVTDVTITCAINSSLTIGGTVNGLSGTGLVLQNNGGNNLTVATNGSFTFTAPLAGGAAYAVTVLTQPTSPTQTCAVSNGSGTTGATNVTNVAVTCTTATFAVGGTISGLGAGSSVVLQNNAGDDLMRSANGSFTFATPVASNGPYSVTVLTNPTTPARTCVVTAGAGTVAAANVTNVVVTCRSKYLFLSNSLGDDSVSSYLIDATNGALSLAEHETHAPDDVTGVAVTPSGSHVFASIDKAAPANGEIAVYLVNNTDGTLTATGTNVVLPAGIDPTGANPKTILVHPLGQHVYVFDGPNGAIHHYSFVAASSLLTFVGTETVNGLYAIAMEPTGTYLYATSYEDRTVTTFAINPTTGALTLAAYPATVLGTQDSEMELTADPTGTFLFVGHKLDGVVVAYRINSTDGQLTFVESESTAAPPLTPGPTALKVDPTGQFLYAVLNDRTILAYTINPTTGALTPLAGNPYSSGSPNSGPGVVFGLGIEASGQYLYQTDFTNGQVLIFSINRTTGALTEVMGPTVNPYPWPVDGGTTGIAIE